MVSGIGEALGSRFSTGCGGVSRRQVGDGRKALLPACGRCRDRPQSQGRRFRPNFRYGTARPVLDKLTREDVPGPSRVLPLDLNGYLAIRKTAQERRPGRGGRLERAASVRNRGAVDIAMIGMMRDARLRMSEAADLTWGDVWRMRGGSGRVSVGGEVRRNIVR